ncbi:MAG: ChaN family lipoprotein [Planctomycetota bacterium]
MAACIIGSGRETGPEHPLAGRIWEVARQRFVAEADLLRILAARRYVLLGEVHDNPGHHRIQERVLGGLAARGRRPAVVLEMISRDHADALQAALADPAVTAQDVRRAVAWDTSGWPDWEIYAPVFETALEAGLALAAGDLSSTDREALRREGIAGLDLATVEALGLDGPLPSPVRATLDASIREGHCDLLPEAALPAMVAVQRTRDARLAQVLAEAAGPDGVVLVAGTGHVRRDVGVPYHLARFDPDAAVVSVGLVEVHAGRADPRSDLAERFAESVPFDFVWFTPRTPREDPCEALKRELAARDHPSSVDSLYAISWFS